MLPDLKAQFIKRYGSDGYQSFLSPEDGLEPGVSIVQAILAQSNSTASLLEKKDLGVPLRKLDVPSNLDSDDVRKAIILAARSRQYAIVGEGPDRLAVQLINRGTNTTFTFVYGEAPILMYENSFQAGRPDKTTNMPRWAANLAKSVEQYLGFLDRNRADIAEVLTEDPEGLAGAPHGSPVAEFPVPSGLGLGEVQDAIVLAGLDRKYTVVSRTHGQAAIRITHRGLVVTHRFVYDDATVRMYTDAHRQSGDGESVDARKLADLVVKEVQIQLARKTL